MKTALIYLAAASAAAVFMMACYFTSASFGVMHARQDVCEQLVKSQIADGRVHICTTL